MKQKRYIITQKMILEIAKGACPKDFGFRNKPNSSCCSLKDDECQSCWLRALGAKEVKDE